MNFYSPMSFLFLIGLIPIVLMYLLKKQHQEVTISSNFLWHRAIRDLEANRPWQKLRKNLLLLLQILLFIMLVMGLTKPYIFSDTISGGNLIIVLDSSASMQSTDVEGSRFEKAKEDIDNTIKNIKPNTKVTLISMANQPKLIVNNSSDKSILQRNLKFIKVSDCSSNEKDTLSLIKSIVKDMKNYKIVFYSDRDIDSSMDNVVVKRINGQGDNLAVENISYSIKQNDLTVLTRVKNYSDKEYNSDLILYKDDEIFDVKEISIGAGENKNIYWYGLPKAVNIIKAELDIEDSLDIDNIRYGVVSSKEISKALLVTEGNVFVEKAIGLNQGVELYKTNEVMEDIEGYDLYIYDGKLPKNIPNDGNLLIFNPPNNSLANIKGTSESGELKLIDNELFRYVNLDFTIGKTKTFVSSNWGEAVLLSNGDPIILKGERNNQKIVALGFDVHDTDFPLKIDFPIFIQNVLDYTLNLNSQEQVSILSGEYINIDVLPKTTEVFVENPLGDRVKVAPPFPLAPYIDTNKVGVYTIEEKYNENIEKKYFVVNVDTKSESSTKLSAENLNENVDIFENEVKTGKDIKDIFIWLALLLLAIEWVVYNREY